MLDLAVWAFAWALSAALSIWLAAVEVFFGAMSVFGSSNLMLHYDIKPIGCVLTFDCKCSFGDQTQLNKKFKNVALQRFKFFIVTPHLVANLFALNGII